MKQLLLLLSLSLAFAANLSAQIGFSNQTTLLTPANHRSGVAIAVLDMDGDGRDDIARLNLGTALNVQYQTVPGKAFKSTSLLEIPNDGSQWGMCAADVDNDGFGDVLAGGYYDGVKILRGSASGTFALQNLASPGTFVQGVNFADVNSDGWLDAFVCHDDGVALIFGNNGDGTFTHQPDWIDLTTYPSSDNSGNYGSVWSDVNNDGYLDLYIAKCRQGVNSSSDPRRINQLFLNNGDGTYSQDTSNASGLRIGAQSWTADFGDIDNDGDFDCFITNHDVTSQLWLNDGAGHFSDVSTAAGIAGQVTGTPIQGVFSDFDNDGFVDIIVAGSQHHIFHNNQNGTFSKIANPFDAKQIESYAIGDLNFDGFQDVYAGYANIYTEPSAIPDALWLNNGNDNHFFGLNLRGTDSNRNAVGAKVTLHTALGIQVREVRAGQSYGISNSLQIHFGLGASPEIDSVVVRWPSGKVDVLQQPTADQYWNFSEDGCRTAVATLATPQGTAFCTGQNINIGTTADYASYLWNTGDTTATIAVAEVGDYRVTVTDAQGCTAISNLVVTELNPVETPTVTAASMPQFCAGSDVQLIASPAAAYLWSTGETTQSITVSTSGQYAVSTQGLCAFFTSDSLEITVLDAVAPLAVQGDSVQVDSVATLSAQGELIRWFTTTTASIPVGSGNIFVTPPLTASKTYWVSNTSVFDQPNQQTGMTDHEGSAFSDNSYNGGLIFDCFEAFKLKTAKVYTNKAGARKIELRDSGGQLLASTTVNIPVGTTYIALDLDIPVGEDFLLTTDAAFNQTAIGTSGPQLRRSNEGCAYPYEIPGVLSIKNSTFNTERYYYFFDWEVDFYGTSCESERVPVQAVVLETSNAVAPAWAEGLQIFPNPTTGILNVTMAQFEGGAMQCTLKNSQGLRLQSRQLALPNGHAAFQADLANLPAGVYWLELATERGIVQRRVVLNR
jgi:hypothetical protein